MSVRELVLLIFWGISCILITVQIIKIRKEKARIPDKDKNSARFMGGMIVVYSIFVLIMCSGMKDFIAMMILAVYLFIAAGSVLVMVFRVLRANQEKQEQFAILSSMSEIYYSMYLVNLKTNAVVEYSRQNEGKEIHTLSQKADEMMHQITDRLVKEAYKEQAEQFTDLHTASGGIPPPRSERGSCAPRCPYPPCR